MKTIFLTLILITSTAFASIEKACEKEINEYCLYDRDKKECVLSVHTQTKTLCDEQVRKVLYNRFVRVCENDLKSRCPNIDLKDIRSCMNNDIGAFSQECIKTWDKIERFL